MATVITGDEGSHVDYIVYNVNSAKYYPVAVLSQQN
jgi:hypothetical protein